MEAVQDKCRILFVIPARGGSKRLPGKNLLEVGGISLLGRAVLAGLAAARRLGGGRVVVSTDDADIAAEARRWGAEVPCMRPAELATDSAGSVEVVLHLLDWFAARHFEFDLVVLLQPTSPLREVDDIVRAVNQFTLCSNSQLATVKHFTASKWAYNLEEDGTLVEQSQPIDTTELSPDSDLNNTSNTVQLNGAVYVTTPDSLRLEKSFCVSGQTKALLMPADRSVDVDTPADLEQARQNWQATFPWRIGRCFIVAEAGVNHNGCLDKGLELIDAAAKAGADAVKFQTFTAEHLATRSAPKAGYQLAAGGQTQFEMLRGLELSVDDYRLLKSHCEQRGVKFLSSAFSEEDVDLLDYLEVEALKLGSGEITNHPLLAYAAATLRPIIISTGASDMDEVTEAVDVLRSNGCDRLALLHCVSSYPAPEPCVNLLCINSLKQLGDVDVGYSDHTTGIEVACAAVALGAQIIEKHFTLDRRQAGPDHRASIEPAELAELVRAVRNVEAALGDGIKRPVEAETNVRITARKSLVAENELSAGTVLRAEHLTAKRPGTGIPPSKLPSVVGMRLNRRLEADELLSWEALEDGEAG